jgi:hypothetical protein
MFSKDEVRLGETYSSAVDGANFKSGRIEATRFALKVVRVFEGVPAEIRVALEGKCELAMSPKTRWGDLMVEPVVQRLPREEAPIVG